MLNFNFQDIKLIFNIIKLNDVLDILIITFLIFFFLYFLKKTNSLKIIIGFIFLFFLYIISYFFNFSLTYGILRGLLGIFTIVLVVIFQEEIRRIFYFFGSYKKTKIKELNLAFLKELAETVFKLASNKIGALILIPGKEPISPYISGGTLLDANFSQALILSIFDPSSPGHDGALILDLEKNKVKFFGAHLPLSKSFTQLKNFGTRHSAGLGISEKTDVLSIIVSEEKGTVRIAYGGKLKNMKNNEELFETLKNFVSNLIPSSKGKLKELITSLEKFLFLFLFSFTLSLIGWFVFTYPNLAITEKAFNLPIEFINVPNFVKIENVNPLEVIVSFRGRNQDFKLLDQSNLKVIVDLVNYKQKGSYDIEISEVNLKYHRSLLVTNIKPTKIKVKLLNLEDEK